MSYENVKRNAEKRLLFFFRMSEKTLNKVNTVLIEGKWPNLYFAILYVLLKLMVSCITIMEVCSVSV